MKKKELVNILNEMLNPLGFKKKGNYWLINNNVITKMINLQKSNYGDAFYINYGYIIHAIPLGSLTMHVYNRVTSVNEEERNRIAFLLNLETTISDEERTKALKEMLQNTLISKVQTVNSEEDLLVELKKRPHLNDITLAVKQHFDL
ncbi:DUF4304 domain-containing protein [Mucilaginibacter sp. UC70_90]